MQVTWSPGPRRGLGYLIVGDPDDDIIHGVFCTPMTAGIRFPRLTLQVWHRCWVVQVGSIALSFAWGD